MQFLIQLLAVIAAVLVHIASARTIDAVAREEQSEKERIVGGRRASAGQFPWSAALFSNGRFTCTSSIISPNTVVTAAHCVVSNGRTQPAQNFHAIANVRKSSPTVRIDFASVTAHPDYSASAIRNDIAIFRTTEPIPFSDTVGPICIARNDTGLMEYRNATAMGWGDTTRLRVFSPDNLMYVSQTIVSNRRCGLAYFGGPLEDSKICAGELLSGICNGDSGGPLVHLSDKTPVQIGVASYGSGITGCALVIPSVWTRVSHFNDFIKENSNGDEICEV